MIDLIYENVKRLADAKGITIAALEREAGIANGTIGKWQKVFPRIDNLQAVCTALDVPITDLLSEESEVQQSE